MTQPAPRTVRPHPDGGYSLIDTDKGDVPADYPYRHVTVIDAIKVAQDLHPGEAVDIDPACADWHV